MTLSRRAAWRCGVRKWWTSTGVVCHGLAALLMSNLMLTVVRQCGLVFGVVEERFTCETRLSSHTPPRSESSPCVLTECLWSSVVCWPEGRCGPKACVTRRSVWPEGRVRVACSPWSFVWSLRGVVLAVLVGLAADLRLAAVLAHLGGPLLPVQRVCRAFSARRGAVAPSTRPC
jgi:hypothetical protein